MTIPEYDLVVIGSGPAGQKAAIGAAKPSKQLLSLTIRARSAVFVSTREQYPVRRFEKRFCTMADAWNSRELCR